ncbi:MAG: autotransporter-associated beta strand repeat-containing protein [Kiritimatiellia bacterium]
MLDQDVSVTGTGTSVISADRVAVANASNVSRVFTVAGTATLNVTGKFEDAATTTGNGMIKAGAGTMILAGNNTYTGPTTVNDGLLISQNGTGIPDLSTVVMANSATAALQITQSEQVGLLSGGGASGGNISVASGATLSTGENGGSAAYDGVISGSNVSLRKRGGGAQTLTGDNTFSGGVEIVSGTLAVPSITTPGVAQPLGMGSGPPSSSPARPGCPSPETEVVHATNRDLIWPTMPTPSPSPAR